MMNLSSLSKSRLLTATLASVLVICLIVKGTTQSLNTMDYTQGGIVILLCAAILFFLQKVSHTITRYSTALELLGKGDFESRIVGITEQGELRTLAILLNRVADLTDAFVREVGHSMEHVAEGKYYRKVLERGMPFSYHRSASALNAVTRSTENKVGKFIKHTAVFEGSVDGIIKGLTLESINLRNAAEKMSDVADTTSKRSENSSKAAIQSTGNVQNVASAAEELAASIAEISRQVNDSSTQTAAAAEQAAETDKLVRGLNDAAQKVGSVVQLINEIASQTNLLALNATIEAARAGEAGKGFAVVANEVKNLATQTTKATEEIVQQINTMQAATMQAVSAVQNIGTRISHVNDISGAIASAVSEQKMATQEIARNIQQAASSTDEVTNDITQVSSAAEDTRSAAVQVQNTAEEFAKQSQTLNKEIRDFIAVVRDTR